MGGGRLSWAQNAWGAWDFLTNEARYANVYRGALANTPGWTFTRASTGYAQNAAGVLVPFASGELRRTDKGVLIEGARTNLCLRSQEFDNATWAKSANATVTANTHVAPDGTQTADTITSSGTGGERITQGLTAGSSVAHTYSVFLKAGVGGQTTLLLRNNTTAVNSNATFTLSGAGSIANLSNATAVIQRLASTDWYWCSITTTNATTAGDSLTCYIYGGRSSGVSGDTSIAWGAQLEAAAWPSSYIPTTTASATRAADALSVTGVSGLDYPLTLFAEFERAVDTGAAERQLQIDTGSNNDRAVLYVETNDRPSAFANTGGVSQGSTSVVATVTVGAVNKIAARFATNSMQIARNGSLGTEDTVVTVPATPSALRFGRDISGSDSFGYLRKALVDNRPWPDAELTARTA